MRFYMTCWRGDFFNHQVKSLEINFPPMFRYVEHGRDHRYIQLRWLIWAMEWKLKK